MKLLFTCTHRHTLEKLWMHTNVTLDILDKLTTWLSIDFHVFESKTCAAFNTKELCRETASWLHHQVKKGANGHSSISTAAVKSEGPQMKKFNLQKYKHHALGDYIDTIREFGTMDSFSMEHVSTCSIFWYFILTYFICIRVDLNTAVKVWYKCTDKGANVRWLTCIKCWQAHFHRIQVRLCKDSQGNTKAVANTPHEHHRIGILQNFHKHIGTFLQKNSGDLAIKMSRKIELEGLLANNNTCSPREFLAQT